MFTSRRNNPRGTLLRISDRRRTMLYIVMSCFLSACAVGPDFMRPKPPVNLHYTFEAEQAETTSPGVSPQHLDRGAPIAVDWWRLFDCAKLDALVTQSFSANPTLQAAQASLRQS